MSDCKTPGAIYATYISEGGVTVSVSLPNKLRLGAKAAKELEQRLHDAIEGVLESYVEVKREGE